MSYQHMFYSVDLDRLKGLYGSGDDAWVADLLKTQSKAIADNDGFFADAIEAGKCPTSESALRDIDGEAAAMYGYVLKIICEQIGGLIGGDVAAVRDHPYKSQLVASGPPIPIPYDASDFPEIGFLAVSDIPGEIQRIDAAPWKAQKSLMRTVLSSLSGGVVGRQMNDEEAVEDMNAYRATLQEALAKQVSIVSFRH
jgi:hypothetical protein